MGRGSAPSDRRALVFEGVSSRSDRYNLFFMMRRVFLRGIEPPWKGEAVLIKIISLTFDSVRGNFDDTPVREFLKDKEVVSIDDHFFLRNEVPYLTLIIKYFPYRQEINPGIAPNGKRDEAWRESLGEADMGVFNLLREWRLKRSREEGVPPYVLFTNKQLVEIAKGRPDSLANLEKIEGIGSQKLGKYGKDVLDITSVQVGGV